MKQVNMKLQSALMGILYGVMCSSPAFADDIEIYTGSSGVAGTITSNILFVLDTSGSMNGTVTDVPPDYVSSTTYTGCFDATRLYNKRDLLINAKKYCDGTSGYDLEDINQFNISAFKCADATDGLDTSGSYISRIAQFRTTTSWTKKKGKWSQTTSTRWSSIDGIDDDHLNDPVECKPDEGVHGLIANDGKPYATNDVPGWTANSSDAVRWNKTGDSETLYTGNYLNQIVEGGGVSSATRLRVMQDALTNVVNAASGINIGLMRFSENAEGGLIVAPMGSVDDAAHKDNFLLELEKMYHSGGTPLAESYYEAVAYMQGKSVDYGNSSTVKQYVDPLNSDPNVADDLEGSMSRLSHTGSRKASNTALYDSPISDTCQKNYIVLLTDGDPSGDSPGGKLANIGVTSSCSAIGTSSCLEEISSHIASNDQGSIAGDQFISTFTIGLDIASAAALLQGTADASKAASSAGEYFPADSAESLTSAFAKIVTKVLAVDTSFSSPAVSVNAYNRATHLEDLYFTLFKPGENESWSGNLKKYKLKFYDHDGDAGTPKVPYISDSSPSPNDHAIKADTGFFKESAVSYWTSVADAPDGSIVEKGGAKGRMTATRNIYTITGNYAETDGVYVPAVPALIQPANAVDKANASLTDALLETTTKPEKIAGTPYRETLLDWAGGLDVLDNDVDGDRTDAFAHMGDPLHAEPALVQYGGSAVAPDLVAYVATNDGYLHAFDVDTGDELFSFIPQELLGSLSVAMENTGSEKLYGLDGNVVAWIKDDNKDGEISGADERVIIYLGMRRGGNDIYALDVTNRNAPELLWVIKGGVGDYAALGETWSTINVEKVKDGATERTVLVFGGGYDETQDDASVRTADAVGNAVFIADAVTGERLWMGGVIGDTPVAEMIYSIPARVKPLDISGDGFLDRLYVADMGGQIFRFDINNTNGDPLVSSITGGRIADLAGAGAADARRFFYPPDVALVDDPVGKYHGIVISSGFRANPVNEVIHDRIYMLKDKKTGPTTTYSSLTEADLQNVTANLAGGDSGAEGDAAADAARAAELSNIQGKQGWYINLDVEGAASETWEGEKGLAEPLILEGTAIVTTYVPDFTQDLTSCVPAAGNGKVYYLDILDGTPAFASDVDKRGERSVSLVRGGIPSSPNVVITENGPATIIGTEVQQVDFGLGLRKTYWYEVEK